MAELAASIPLQQLRGSAETQVREVAYDSRRVRGGELFAALVGLHTDGHSHVEDALRRGAAAVLHSAALPRYAAGVAYLRVPDTRQALSPLAAAFFGHPSRRLTVVGVTGTDGKSTTVWLIQQLLQGLGAPSGFLSTVHVQTGSKVEKNPLRQSTPEAPDVQRVLRRMLDAGKRYAVLEATSHGLSERTGRLRDVRFAAAAVTNISHEHLEFHGSFEQYRSDKANLFRALSAAAGPSAPAGPPAAAGRPAPGPFGVVNQDDPSASYLRGESRAPVFSYSLRDPVADLWAGDLEGDLSGSSLTLHRGAEAVRVHLGLPGAYNAQNLLAAVLVVANLLDLPLEAIAPQVERLEGVPGRMQRVRGGQPFEVIVDYAHTPRAFEQLLPLVRRHCSGRLIAVFGSAGERDVDKRSQQGALAGRLCDTVILTDEDPRAEDRLQILQAIAAGVRSAGKEPLVEPERREAIRNALKAASAGDTVLLLGKGHEESILYAEGPRPWNEAQVAAQLLGELGYGP
ncbi:MAG: UDP-N-acetylmuramoyl-L-alanyl-D-glutamate--2,6-diaminopimelate ligase [Spirochaetales bacterium]|nr:UDP-N-acetylmuramoyl-L-alanyl-D-glutamate--2,6-diaminopimelate ligase [Spirochaetales bacterium]